MAHIPDGVASIPVLLAGATVSLGGIALGLRRLTPERLPKVAVLSALFFVALSGKEFMVAGQMLVFTYLPLMVVEAVFTAAVLGLLAKVKPEALEMSA